MSKYNITGELNLIWFYQLLQVYKKFDSSENYALDFNIILLELCLEYLLIFFIVFD